MSVNSARQSVAHEPTSMENNEVKTVKSQNWRNQCPQCDTPHGLDIEAETMSCYVWECGFCGFKLEENK